MKLVHSSGSASFSSVEAAIAAINKKYPQIKLQYVGRRGDTVVTRIPEASYLTQEIGTAGAEVYFAEATFSLTEVPAINAVTFNFEEGDHAMPGTYSRKSFEDLK
ncbi:hypothetical protein [Arcticibacter sp. MXS-1]|uniref:hypothetical protein n=1 Tax=Arcticibacter sp. MXS-1 TaxID=3341726 RepID=UPI0035A91AEB